MGLIDQIKKFGAGNWLGGGSNKIPIEGGWPGGTITADVGGGDGGVDISDETQPPAPTLKDKVTAGPSPAFTEDPSERSTAGAGSGPSYHDQSGNPISVFPSQSNPATQRPPGGTLKDKIIRSVTAAAPVLLGGAFGGAAGAAGAGEGELELNQQNEQLDLKNRTLESESQNRIMQRIQEQQRYEESVKRDKIAQQRADDANDHFNTTNNRLVDNMQRIEDDKNPYISQYTDKDGNRIGVKRDKTTEIIPGPKARVPPEAGSQGTRMVDRDGNLLDIKPGGKVPKGAKTPAQFGAPTPEGPHAIMVDPSGKVIDAKPGMTIPTGAQTPSSVSSGNAATVKADKGVTDDISFAQNYLNSGKFSGSSDEALLERFFDLTKPSTGFRMNKPQQDLLFDSRSWKDSASARFRHATSGTWFSTEQRKQIIQTMMDVAAANGVSLDGLAPGNAAPGQGGAGTRGGVRPPTTPAAPQNGGSDGDFYYDQSGNRVKGGGANARH